MYESDTMFNKRYRRCTAVQLMLSTDQSYDNRSIASTLKMQIRTVHHLRAQLNASDDPWKVVERKDTARKTRTKEFIEKVQAIIDETPQPPIRQITRDLGVSHTSVNVRVKEDLKCWSDRRQASQILTEKTKNLRLIKSFRPPPPSTWTRWTTSFGHTSRTSPTWPPTTPKPAWSPLSTDACGKGMLPVPDLYRGDDWGWRQNQVTWNDFFNKVLKSSCSVFFFRTNIYIYIYIYGP